MQVSQFLLPFYRIWAPTTNIFFASAIPVISFGEQLERDTGTKYYSDFNGFFFFPEKKIIL